MTVFTDITQPRFHEQISEIEQAFGFNIVSIRGMAPGSADSKFEITVRGVDDPLVLTIHETLKGSAGGVTNEISKNMLHYLDFLSDAIRGATDRFAGPVNIHVLKSLKANPGSEVEAPYLELSFDGDSKPVSIVPFINGKSFVNSPDEVVDPDTIHLAGRALAAYLLIARTYPDQASFAGLPFGRFVQDIKDMIDDRETLERLGYLVTSGQFHDKAAEKFGLEYISEMYESGEALLEQWRTIESGDSPLFHSLIHTDMFTDNTMIDLDGRFYLLDFSHTCNGSIGIDIGVALSSWASQHGRPRLESVHRYLEAFETVIPLTGEALTLIPPYAQIGAFRWETFRIQRIAKQNPRKYDMRSPAEFQSLRRSWQRLRGLFESARSVQDLASSRW